MSITRRSLLKLGALLFGSAIAKSSDTNWVSVENHWEPIYMVHPEKFGEFIIVGRWADERLSI